MFKTLKNQIQKAEKKLAALKADGHSLPEDIQAARNELQAARVAMFRYLAKTE